MPQFDRPAAWKVSVGSSSVQEVDHLVSEDFKIMAADG